jgi:hypothetical protein
MAAWKRQAATPTPNAELCAMRNLDQILRQACGQAYTDFHIAQQLLLEN